MKILPIIFVVLQAILLVATFTVMKAGVQQMLEYNIDIKNHIDTKTAEIKSIQHDQKSQFKRLLKLLNYEIR